MDCNEPSPSPAVRHQRGWLAALFRKWRGNGIPLKDFIAIAYGANAGQSGEVIGQIGKQLGSDRIRSLGDMRRVSRMLDRQKYSTALNICFETADIEYHSVNGISCPIDTHDLSVSLPGATSGDYEPHIAVCLRRICRPGGVFFDIGANVGFHALLLSRIVGPAGRVIAFEPNSENCRLILLGAAQAAVSNIDLLPVALSESQGWSYFSVHLGSNGGLVDEAFVGLRGHGVIVPTFRLDALELPDPDVIKVDVEGAEYRALRGGSRMIERARPLIVCEFSMEMTRRVSGIDPDALLTWMADLDYAIHVIDRGSHRSEEVGSPAELLAGWPSLLHIEDLLFVPREKLGLLRSEPASPL